MHLYTDTPVEDLPSVIRQILETDSFFALETRDVFDQLPAELLAHIFLIGVRDQQYEGVEPFVPFNLVVSSVCRRWRNIALMFPLLWQRITMRESEPYRWTQLCLERTKQCPLDIALWLESEDGEVFGADHMSQVMDILQPHVNRWRTFGLAADDFQPLHYFFSRLATCHAPILETLHLYNNCPFYMDTILDGSHPFIVLPPDIAPRLTSLKLCRVHLKWDVFPFANLNHLELLFHRRQAQYTIPQLVQILSASPTLETLVFRASGPFYSPVELGRSTDSLTLPSLRTFRISRFSDPNQVAFLTRLIRAPNLESLTITDFDVADFSSVLFSLGQPSVGYPSVIHLRIEHINVPDRRARKDAFIALFTALNRVAHLSLNAYEPCEDIFASLENPPPSSASKSASEMPALLLPLLATLQVTEVEELSRVKSFISTRQSRGFPMQKLILNCLGELDESDIETLRSSVTAIEMFDPTDDEDDMDDDNDEDEDEDEDEDDEEDNDEDDGGLWEDDLDSSESVGLGGVNLFGNEGTDSDDELDLIGGNN